MIVFVRLPPTTRQGDRVQLSDGCWGTVDTAKIADDHRDAKCTVILDAEEDTA